MSGRVFGFDYRHPAHPRLVSGAFYGGAIDESVLAFAFSGSNTFVAGDFTLNATDSIFVADITQPRNFIRHMCYPPPFGSNATAIFPEVRKTVPSGWNFKVNPSRGLRQHP